MKVYRISAITLRVKDMEKSCTLYSKIPGFSLTYGGKPSDRFTTFEIGKGNNATYLNLELIEEEEEIMRTITVALLRISTTTNPT